MALRLLEKSDVLKAKNADRAKEIAEGLKISQKVDLLRELKVSEEESLSKWRDETISAISLELEKLDEQKQMLTSEISTLRKEIEKGMGEVDTARTDLDTFEIILEERAKSLAKRLLETEEKEKEAKKTLKEAKNELESARSHKEEAERLHRESLEERKDAKVALMVAENTKEQASLLKQKVEDDLLLRGEILGKREAEANEKDKSLLELAENLRIKELQLTDREKTLEREFKRLHGQR